MLIAVTTVLGVSLSYEENAQNWSHNELHHVEVFSMSPFRYTLTRLRSEPVIIQLNVS